MTPISTRRRCNGFTLIELLVTLVIIGLLAGLASLSVGGRAHRQARDEAERVYQLLGFASEEAMMQGEELGLQIDGDSYGFLRFDQEEEEWVPMEEPQFRTHAFPPGIEVEVELDDGERLPNESRDSGASAPEILLLSSGEVSAFHLEFMSPDSSDPAASISSDGSGSVRWQ